MLEEKDFHEFIEIVANAYHGFDFNSNEDKKNFEEYCKKIHISEKYHDYADKVAMELRNNGVRVEVDYRAEKIGYKIREARMERLPYMLVVGEKEAENNEVAVRSRKNGDEGSMSLEAFAKRIVEEIKNREK